MSETTGPPDTEVLKRLARHSGDPWVSTNRYFETAEAHMEALWTRLIYPFISDCDFTAVIDLAAGHGRNSEMLRKVAGTLTIMDIQPGNVEFCKERFAGDPGIICVVNSGYDLAPVADASTTLIYCFDAMVHFDSDVVRSYLRDTLRVLKPGGRGFFHHSNYAVAGVDWKDAPSARNFMTAELFKHYAIKEGLSIVRQQVINWGNLESHDCLTLVERPV